MWLCWFWGVLCNDVHRKICRKAVRIFVFWPETACQTCRFACRNGPSGIAKRRVSPSGTACSAARRELFVNKFYFLPSSRFCFITSPCQIFLPLFRAKCKHAEWRNHITACPLADTYSIYSCVRGGRRSHRSAAAEITFKHN